MTRGGKDLEVIKLKGAVISKKPGKVLRTFQPMLVNGGIQDMHIYVRQLFLSTGFAECAFDDSWREKTMQKKIRCD